MLCRLRMWVFSSYRTLWVRQCQSSSSQRFHNPLQRGLLLGVGASNL
jgi:hypothetical protein